MNVAAHRERVSRLSPSSPVTHRQNIKEPCVGNLQCVYNEELASVGTPTAPVDPQESLPITVTLTNHGPHFSPNAQDITACRDSRNTCTKGAFETDGYCVSVHVDPAWSSEIVTEPVCHHFASVGSQSKVIRGIELPPPGVEGTQEVTVWIELADGETSGPITRSIDYREGGSSGCQSDGDCPRGFVCQNGACVEDTSSGGGGGGAVLPCFLDPNRSCATPEVVAWAGVGLLLLVLVVAVE